MQPNARVCVAVSAYTYDPEVEEDLYLIMKNKKTGRWEFPGGKLIPGETASGAAEREFLEETGHRANIGNLGRLFSNHTKDGFTFVLLIFISLVPEKFIPKLTEHTEFKWVGWQDLHRDAQWMAPRLRATVEELNMNHSIFDRDVTDLDFYPWYPGEDIDVGIPSDKREGPNFPLCDQI